MVLSDNGKTSRYTYNAAGERIVKSHGDLEGVYVNGAPQGITSDCVDFRLRLGKTSKLLFLSACTEVPRDGGLHHLSCPDYHRNEEPLYQALLHRRQAHCLQARNRQVQQRLWHQQQQRYGRPERLCRPHAADRETTRGVLPQAGHTPPGVPTMKGATADPDNTGYGYNTIIGELGDHSVPEGWVQRPKFNDKGDVPGPPIQWNKPEDPDNAQPGYGYVPADTTNTEDIFFYHSDHLGSTSYITDAKANITQFDAYLPYGELLVDEHSSTEEMPYKFNGKEFEEETGLYYYGARYMNPRTSLWYGVDPLAEKYPSVSSLIYCFDNPIKFIDPEGMSPKSKPTIKQTLEYGMKHSKTFKKLMSLAGITLDNYNKYISFGNSTETDPVTGEITLTEGSNKKFQVIKLAHELSNKINRKELQGYDEKVERNKISIRRYALLVAKKEIDGEINQIKVAADIGFHYPGKKFKSLNDVIDSYSKNKSMNLRKIVEISKQHISTYMEQGKRLQQAYQNRRRKRQ